MQDGANARSPIKLARVGVKLWPMLASAGMALPLPHRGPGSVRIATSVAAGDLRLTVDVDGVSVRSALQPVGLIANNCRSVQKDAESLQVVAIVHSLAVQNRHEGAGGSTADLPMTCPAPFLGRYHFKKSR